MDTCLLYSAVVMQVRMLRMILMVFKLGIDDLLG